MLKKTWKGIAGLDGEDRDKDGNGVGRYIWTESEYRMYFWLLTNENVNGKEHCMHVLV